MTRRLMAGTGWKMNHSLADTRAYAAAIPALIDAETAAALDLFVLPPFTALTTAAEAFKGTGVGIGAQNVHWEEKGAWTGEVSAPMLEEIGCRYVALAHSERLTHFNESYERVGQKVGAALAHGLTPVLCLGETAAEKDEGRADDVLRWQVETALAGAPGRCADVVLAYEPRWAIGGAAAATPDYVAERHGLLRDWIGRTYGAEAAAATRIIYGGSVTPENGPALIALDGVDGLFTGRAAWTPEGFAKTVHIVAEAARKKSR